MLIPLFTPAILPFHSTIVTELGTTSTSIVIYVRIEAAGSSRRVVQW
jgi:hypothetical protein